MAALALVLAEHAKAGETITWYDHVLFSKPYYMVFSKRSPYPDIRNIVERFDHELLALKRSGEYEAVSKKWFP